MAQRITRLNTLTANQIAAGEVIERPVSVVKELIENAIDAGSSRIRIDIRDGGLSRIVVEDNGGGIDYRDLSLAVERHATSKLRRIEDLDKLDTLGFRGEALASIASVSALEIETRQPGDTAGYRLQITGEETPPSIGKAGCPEGTKVTVEQLFYNTPARLKFMKSPGYESGLIHDLVIQAALGYPAIGFRLENQGRPVVDTYAIDRTEDLVELFYGREARQALIPVDGPVSKGMLRGWMTAPPFSRGTRKGYFVYVNGRHVVAKDTQWAMERAFSYVLPKGRFPIFVLHMRFPGELLDVNIHPGKTEIRINDPDCNGSITRLLRTALSGGQGLPDISGIGMVSAAPSTPALGSSALGSSVRGKGSAAYGQNKPPGESVEDWATLFAITASGEEVLTGLLQDNAEAEETGPYGGIGALSADSVLVDPEEKNRSLNRPLWGVQQHNRMLRALAGEQPQGDFTFDESTGFHVIGQLHKTFILAEVRAGLLVADQHVAHERILYEEMLRLGDEKQVGQMLIQPLQISLTTGEEETLIRNILVLNDLGLLFERFGPRQYLLRAEPTGQAIDESMVRELLGHLADDGEGDINAARQSLLVMRACKAAVKANTPLSLAEMHSLLATLQRTPHPMTCPHGRPILYLLPYKRLIQAFGRSS